MEETQNVQPDYAMPPKPDNNMALAIFTTVCCCLPLGIVAILKASKVNTYYAMQMYDAAVFAANEARKYSIIGIVASLVINVIYFILSFLSVIPAALAL